MRNTIVEQNPWWADKNAINRDKHIIDYQKQKVRFPLPTLESKAGLYVLRGPRQVGKTTMLKFAVNESIAHGMDPNSLVYINLESGATFEDVKEFLDANGKETGGKVVLIDEATAHPDWAIKVKYLVDSGKLTSRDLVIITGSSSLDLKKGSDRLPGRGIEGNEFLIYPYSFARVCSIGEQEQFSYELLSRHFKNSELAGKFLKYIDYGGFPPVWNADRDLMRERYSRWIEGVISKEGKSLLYTREILERLCEKSVFNFYNIAKQTSVLSYHTVSDYIEMFGYLMLGRLLYTYNPSTGTAEHKKEKKFIFHDPFLAGIAGNRDEPFVVEDIVGSHLARVSDELYFYRDRKKEIDFLCKVNGECWAVEVKWREEVSQRDVAKLRAFKLADRKFIVCKDEFRKDGDVAIVPAYAFLAAIGKTVVRRRVLHVF